MGNKQHQKFSWQGEYRIIQKNMNDGTLIIMHEGSDQEFIGRQLICRDSAQLNHVKKLIKLKASCMSPFVTKLAKYHSEFDESYCSSEDKLHVLFHKPGQTLREEVLARKFSGQRVSEEEADIILEDGVKGLQVLRLMGHPHNNIATSSFFVDKNRKVILGDPWITPPAYTSELNHNLCAYPSPQKILFQNDQIMQFCPYRSDLFSLGMVILEVLNFQHMDIVYEKGFRRVIDQKVKEKLSNIRNQELRRRLTLVLSFDPSDRDEIFKLYRREKASGSGVRQKLVETRVENLTLTQNIKPTPFSDKHKSLYKYLPHQQKRMVPHNNSNRPTFQQSHQAAPLATGKDTQTKPIVHFTTDKPIVHFATDKPNHNISSRNPISVRQNSTGLNHPIGLQRPNSAKPFAALLSDQPSAFEKADSRRQTNAPNYQPYAADNQRVTIDSNDFQTKDSRAELRKVMSHPYTSSQVKKGELNSSVNQLPRIDANLCAQGYGKSQDNSSNVEELVNSSLEPNSSRHQNQYITIYNHNGTHSSSNGETNPKNLNTNQVRLRPQSENHSVASYNSTLRDQQSILSRINQMSIDSNSTYNADVAPLNQQNNQKTRNYTPERRPKKKFNSTIRQVSESEVSNEKEELAGESNGKLKEELDAESDQEYVEEQCEAGLYKGSKRNGRRNGYGKLLYRQGSMYEGEWKNNMMHGKGKLYYVSGKVAYDGEWNMDEFHGQGKVYNEEELELNGAYNYRDMSDMNDFWVSYEGSLDSDRRHGKGKLKFSNGEIFVGNFNNDLAEGEGKFYTLKGQIISGVWQNNQLMSAL